MTTGTLTLRVRPVRFAFLVDPTDTKGLYSAIELSTCVWGGPYSALIPVFKKLPKNWDRHPIRNLSPQEIVKGYLDGFDPDVVVPVGAAAKRNLDIGHRETTTVEYVLKDFKKNQATNYGIGVSEVLRDLLAKEFKYQRADLLQLSFPRLPKLFRLFFASVFGALPPDIEAAVKERIPQTVPVNSPEVSFENYTTFLDPNFLFPRRLCYWSLDERYLFSPTLFLLDATKGLDIVDYWNLRAAGHYVVPVPVQAVDIGAVKALARKFVEENYQPYHDNPSMFHRTTVQQSRSITDQQAQEFIKQLELSQPENRQQPKLLLRPWYPSIWDRWARDHANQAIRFPHSHEVEVTISDTAKRMDLRAEAPRIPVSGRAFSGKAKFANELTFAFYGAKEPMAEVIPEGGSGLSRAIGPTGTWRFSPNGPVFLASYQKDLLFVELPTAESVMTEWLRERGWKASLSAPGRMTLQLYRHLGGEFGMAWLTHRGVIPLLSDLEKEAGLPWPAVAGRLQKIINEEKLHFTKERFVERLIESGALRLGASVQCTVCTRHNWYEMDKLRYELQCKFCLSNFAPPLESPKEIAWTYRAHGPFASSAAQGGFSVLLTLRFLIGRRILGRLTPLFSYVATKGEDTLESDLTCLFKDERDSQTHVVHAECKSYGGFEARDFQRMTQLAREFPGAALIFGTLMDKLDSYSRKNLIALAMKQRKLRFARKPYSPIIVLTARELFTLRGAPECWDGVPFYEDIRHAGYNEPLLDVWADATQRLHLDLPAWHVWSRERAKARSSPHAQPAVPVEAAATT